MMDTTLLDLMEHGAIFATQARAIVVNFS